MARGRLTAASFSIMFVLGTGSAQEAVDVVPTALPLFAAALATIGNLVFGVFAWRTGIRSARAFSYLCASLALFSRLKYKHHST